MIVVISPAKNLDFKKASPVDLFTLPEFLDKSKELIGTLRGLTPQQISKLMGISPQLGELNFQRFHQWALPFTPENAKQAGYAFNGMVYQGLNFRTVQPEAVPEFQKRLRILSGLYGVLRPLDLIQPYRLEMGTELHHKHVKNLYEYWSKTITGNIKQSLEESGNPVLVNLASAEYFKSIDLKKLKTELVTPEFMEESEGKLKTIIVYTKKARGLMTRFIIGNQITKVSDLAAFDSEGYRFNSRLSKPGNPVFTRISG